MQHSCSGTASWRRPSSGSPVLAAIVLGQRAVDLLDRGFHWLTRHQRPVTVSVLVGVGTLPRRRRARIRDRGLTRSALHPRRTMPSCAGAPKVTPFEAQGVEKEGEDDGSQRRRAQVAAGGGSPRSAALLARGPAHPAPQADRERATAGGGVPDRPRRADARRQRAPERGDVRDDVDGAPGRAPDGRVLRQEHDRQGRVPADGRARDALREHPRRPLARARADEATGCSTTGSSEAAMLGGLALKRRWQKRRQAEGKPRRQAEHRHGRQRPGLLGEVRELLGGRDAARADGGRALPPLGRGGRGALRREHDRRGRRSSARRSTAPTSRSPRSAPRSTRSSRRRDRRPGARRRRLGRHGRAVRRPRPRLGLPAAARRLDQHVRPQVRPRLPGRRLDRLARRGVAARRADLPRQLPRRHMPTFALNFSRPGAQVVAQYYNFLRLGFEGFRRVQQYARDVATGLVGADRRPRAVRAAHARRRAAGVRVPAERRRSTTTPSSISRPRCASAAGRCPRTRSRRTAPTSPPCASSCGAASRTTWPTSSSPT